MKLYDLQASPNARRVRIFLAEKGIEIPTVQVDIAKGEHRQADYLARNSLGKMPLLELDDGTCISKSIAICRYMEETHPEPPLFGRDALQRARVEMWQRRMELEILQPIGHIFLHSHEMWQGIYPQVPEWAAVCRETAAARMQWLDGELAGRAFIATEDYTVADITAQCALLMGKAVGARIPPELANLTAWWEGVVARPTARA